MLALALPNSIFDKKNITFFSIEFRSLAAGPSPFVLTQKDQKVKA